MANSLRESSLRPQTRPAAPPNESRLSRRHANLPGAQLLHYYILDRPTRQPLPPSAQPWRYETALPASKVVSAATNRLMRVSAARAEGGCCAVAVPTPASVKMVPRRSRIRPPGWIGSLTNRASAAGRPTAGRTAPALPLLGYLTLNCPAYRPRLAGRCRRWLGGTCWCGAPSHQGARPNARRAEAVALRNSLPGATLHPPTAP